MSNKPKVYGTCAAGCRWQVPHMSDLERTAAYIRQVPESVSPYVGNIYALDAGKTYLLSLPVAVGGVAQYAGMTVTWYVEYPNSMGLDTAKSYHRMAEPFLVGVEKADRMIGFPVKTSLHVHGVRLNKDNVFELVFEEDGQLMVYSLISVDEWGLNLDGDEKFVIDSISVNGATECLLYNSSVQTVIDPEKVGDGLIVDEDGVLKVDALIPAAGVTKITKDKIFYQMYNDIELAIDCDFESLPFGYFGFISITGAGGTITSDKLYETSENGKTLAEVDYDSGAVIMVIKSNTGSKLSWYYFC